MTMTEIEEKAIRKFVAHVTKWFNHTKRGYIHKENSPPKTPQSIEAIMRFYIINEKNSNS